MHFYARELQFSRTPVKQLLLHQITAFLDVYQHAVPAPSRTQTQPPALQQILQKEDLFQINTVVKEKANRTVLPFLQHFTTDAALKLAQSLVLLGFPCETSSLRIHAEL